MEALEDLAPDAWREVLAVARGDAPAGLPAVAGSYRLERGRVRFEPAFPFLRGGAYVARWSGLAGGEPVHLEFAIEGHPAAPATRVVAVHPRVERVPSNLLRLYVEFSAPMSVGEADRRVRLLDRAGDVVDGAFVAIGEELWSASGERLTLIFDPGRIKRGVGPNVERGPPLEEGREYRLVVDGDWPDATGRPLAGEHVRTLHVGPADRRRPSVERWALTAPSGGREPLELRFDEPLDRALLARWLWVRTAAGRRLGGTTEVIDGGLGWRLSPDEAWTAGRYVVEIDSRLEDLAGNSLRRDFDAAQTGEAGAGEEREGRLEIPFRVE